MPEEAIGQFFTRAWAVYEKVVAADYLSHRQLYAGLRTYLENQAPMRFLELGCGDARASVELLRGLEVEAYLGIDSSLGVLDLARKRVQPGWAFEVGDVRELPAVGNHWTVALASFCLHHLSSSEKRRTLSQVSTALGTEGIFLLVDIFREEGESRHQYLERRRAWMRAEWTALSSEELDLVMEHEQAADFPETVSDYTRWALGETSFRSVEENLIASDGMHRWLTFRC